MLRRAKENIFKDRFTDAVDYPRKTWRLLNGFNNNSRSKKKKSISEIKVRIP